MPDKVLVQCKITRGGFSTERVFRIQWADGEIHIGASPVRYCLTKTGHPLKPDDPPAGKMMEGTIQAMLIKPGEDEETGLVYFPDGEVILVPMELIQQPSREGRPHVSH